MEETEMSVVLADPLISCWRGFFHLPRQLRTGGGPPHEPFDEGSAWIFCAGSTGTPQNELIASTSLWTTDSPPAGVPPHSAENGKLHFCHFRHQQGRRKVTLRLGAGDFHAVVDFRAFGAL